MSGLAGHQGCAEADQNEEAGSTHDASSMTPVFTKKTPGITSTRLKSCEPHCPQKLRTTPPPLSPCTRHERGSPSSSNAASGTMQNVAKALPVAR